MFLICTGYGWAGGHYIPADSNFYAYLFQFAVIGVLIWLSINVLKQEYVPAKTAWAENTLTVVAALSLLANILNVIRGAFNKDIHSFGSHNTLADLVPIALLVAGSGVWIFTFFTGKRHHSLFKQQKDSISNKRS